MVPQGRLIWAAGMREEGANILVVSNSTESKQAIKTFYIDCSRLSELDITKCKISNPKSILAKKIQCKKRERES